MCIDNKQEKQRKRRKKIQDLLNDSISLDFIDRKALHQNNKSHDCGLYEYSGKKIKITYEAYNGVERCNSEIFDGFKWNIVFTINDLGVKRNCSAYNLLNESERETRADMLFDISSDMLYEILK